MLKKASKPEVPVNSLRVLMASAGYRAHGILAVVKCCAPVHARFPSGLFYPDSVVLPENVPMLTGSKDPSS